MTGIKLHHVLNIPAYCVYLNGQRVARAHHITDLPGWAKGLPLLGVA